MNAQGLGVVLHLQVGELDAQGLGVVLACVVARWTRRGWVWCCKKKTRTRRVLLTPLDARLGCENLQSNRELR